jgi:hypothetical protein
MDSAPESRAATIRVTSWSFDQDATATPAFLARECRTGSFSFLTADLVGFFKAGTLESDSPSAASFVPSEGDDARTGVL